LSYTILFPDGKIKADTYTELLARLRAEGAFWMSIGPFDLEDLETQVQTRSFVQSFIPSANARLHAWEKHILALEELDGREFSKTSTQFIEEVESDLDLPPLSSSNISLILKSLWDRRRYDAVLAGFLAMDDYAGGVVQRIDQVQHQALGAFVGFGRAILELGSTLPPPPSDTTFSAALHLQEETARKLTASLGLEIEHLKQDLAREKQLKSEFEKSFVARLKKLHRHSVSLQRKSTKSNRRINEERDAEFLSMKEAFALHMSLKHPVKLWGTKKDSHTRKSKEAWSKFVIGAALLSTFFALLVLLGGDAIAETFVKRGCGPTGEAICKGFSAKGPLTLSTIVLFATVSLWFLRLQMKIFLSERHLALDAEERTAFSEAYLALLKEGSATRENETIILQSIFRPTQDGIINDEAGPDFSVAGLLSKALSNSGK
jgi:hypothetical protein